MRKSIMLVVLLFSLALSSTVSTQALRRQLQQPDLMTIGRGGTLTTPFDNPTQVVCIDGSITYRRIAPVNVPTANHTYAYGINNAGEVVGTGSRGAFRLTAGNFTTGPTSQAETIRRSSTTSTPLAISSEPSNSSGEAPNSLGFS